MDPKLNILEHVLKPETAVGTFTLPSFSATPNNFVY